MVDAAVTKGKLPDPVAETVSVVMPVRNGLPYLHASIESILTQSFEDFELVILDDVSDDGSWTELLRWKDRDRRIRLIRSDVPLGPSGASNRVVRESNGSLVARMDADDVSHSGRLLSQVAAFEADREMVLAGSLASGIDASGRRVRPVDASRALRHSSYPPFPHGSAMFRRSAFDAVGGYRSVCDGWEDIDLFLRLAELGKAVTVIEPLYSYRFHPESWTLVADGDARLRAFELEQRSLAEHARSGSYEAILARADDVEITDAGRLHAYNYKGAVSVWSGVRLQSMRRAGARWTWGAGRASAARSLLNSTWGRVAPSSLRTALSTWIRLKDRAARHRLGPGNQVEWVSR